MATVTYNFWIGSIKVDYNNSFQVTIDQVLLDVSLASLRYHKKMFQPCMILAKLKLSLPSGSTTMPSADAILKTFKNSKVTFKEKIGDKTTTIAQNYYVFKVIPEFTRSGGVQSVYVTLHIYSPDHKLTLDKYCRSYSNRKLANDILSGGVNDKEHPLSKAGFTADTIDVSHLKFLNYLYSDTNNDLKYREFIQPYLLQYNESFYDFMARTANRCGEFWSRRLQCCTSRKARSR